jgi:hypothetical protein
VKTYRAAEMEEFGGDGYRTLDRDRGGGGEGGGETGGAEADDAYRTLDRSDPSEVLAATAAGSVQLVVCYWCSRNFPRMLGS